jgi:hypothetical protein
MADPDPHQNGKLDPHQNGMQDPDPHLDPHQSDAEQFSTSRINIR